MFENRIDAGKQLAKKLESYKNTEGVVIAIPRGGVPIGKIVADYLGFPLEIVLSKKISHPLQKEYAIGAVSLESRVLDGSIDVPDFYIENETKRLRELLRERFHWYYEDKAHIPLTDKNVIIVDDGIATGYTMLSTLELIQEQQPKKIVIATPVCSRSSVEMLRASSIPDEIISLRIPRDFRSVGRYYENFQQVTDEEVKRLLTQASSLSMD